MFTTWAVVSGFITTMNLGKHLERKQGINRIYVLTGGHVLRLEYGNGNQIDVPISAFNIKKVDTLS